MIKKLIILAIFAFASCSIDDDCPPCEAIYYNPTTNHQIRATSDCNRVAPEGYVFVKCLTIDY